MKMESNCTNELGSKNLICCLEFLSQETLDNNMIEEHALLKSTIDKISKIDSLRTDSKLEIKYLDIVNAFKLFIKFCMIEDPDIKKRVVSLMEDMDKNALFDYAGCA